MIQSPIVQSEYGVLVGILGELRGRLFVIGGTDLFAQAGLAMYGMELSGDMLESFVGEFGNSVAGHTATRLSEVGIQIDITPPTTLQGQVKLGGFSKAIQIPFTMQEATGTLILAVEEA